MSSNRVQRDKPFFLMLIGQATFYIYLLHPAFQHFPRNVLNWDSGWANFIVGLTGSVGVWLAVTLVLRLRNRRRIAVEI